MRLLLLLSLVCSVHSYNILVYIPKIGISHINFLGKLADTLVEAGHNVTALISEMDSSLPDGTKKAQQIVRISTAVVESDNSNPQEEWVDMFETNFDSYNSMLANAHQNSVLFCRQCKKLISTPGLVESLKREKFDVLVTEAFEMCGVGLSHLISPRALVIGSSTLLYNPSAYGIHYSLVAEPSMMDGSFDFSIYSRLKSVYDWFLFQSFVEAQNDPLQTVFEEYFPGTPPLSSLLADAAVVFTNTDPLVEFARPTLSKVVPIGGIAVPTPRPLDEHWSGILSLRPRSVLVSFGSIAKSVFMTRARKSALLKAFASFPDTTFIWKYENKEDEFATSEASNVPNVLLTEWAPQNDLLADPRLILFISHGGMASCLEIAHSGVPAVLIPIFGDQMHNAAGLAHAGIAKVFNKFEMTESEKLRHTIEEMLNNSSYKSTATRIRDQLAARHDSPAARFVKNVEFAARFGPSKSLRPLSLELSTIQFIGLDLIIVAFIATFIALLSIIYLFNLFRNIAFIVRMGKIEKLE